MVGKKSTEHSAEERRKLDLESDLQHSTSDQLAEKALGLFLPGKKKQKTKPSSVNARIIGIACLRKRGFGL
jgi:hypothetical protein